MTAALAECAGLRGQDVELCRHYRVVSHSFGENTRRKAERSSSGFADSLSHSERICPVFPQRMHTPSSFLLFIQLPRSLIATSDSVRLGLIGDGPALSSIRTRRFFIDAGVPSSSVLVSSVISPSALCLALVCRPQGCRSMQLLQNECLCRGSFGGVSVGAELGELVSSAFVPVSVLFGATPPRTWVVRV